MNSRTTLITILFVWMSIGWCQAQDFEPKNSLQKILTEYKNQIDLETYIDQELVKLERLVRAAKGDLVDTIFNLRQNRLYDFFIGYLKQKNSLPLTSFSSDDLAEYSVNYMKSLEAQRQSADVLYNHTKHQMAQRLIANTKPRKSRRILESIELLGRGTLRLMSVLEISDLESLNNHMTDKRVQKILKSYAKVQKKAIKLGLTNISTFQFKDWNLELPNEIIKNLTESYNTLMQPIDTEQLNTYSGHLKALVRFQTAYTKLIGSVFELYLKNTEMFSEEINISGTGAKPLTELRERWIAIDSLYKDRFDDPTLRMLKIQPDENLSWLLSDLKKDYFSFRLLMRHLNVVQDIEGKVTVLSRSKIRKKMDSLARVWNTTLSQTEISLDTTRSSLTKMIKIALPNTLDNALSEQIKKIDTIIKGTLLKEMSWSQKNLDSLQPTDTEKKQLKELADKTIIFLKKVVHISSSTKEIKNQFAQHYTINSEWKNQNEVRYVLLEKIPIDTEGKKLSRKIRTGVHTPWIKVPSALWNLKLEDFKNSWKDILKQTNFEASSAIQNWLNGHGFPGSIKIENGIVLVNGGLPFEWLGKKWLFVFNNTVSNEVAENTVVLSFEDITNTQFWSQKIEEIAKEEWTKARASLEQQVRDYWSVILENVSFQLPEALEGYLRGDQLIYPLHMGEISADLSGASLIFMFKKNTWSIDYQISHTLLINRMTQLLPQLVFKNVVHDTISKITEADLGLVLDTKNPTIEIGKFEIDKRGSIRAIALNDTKTTIKFGKGFEIQFGGFNSYADNFLSSSTVVFKEPPFHLENLDNLNLEFTLKFQLFPKLQIHLEEEAPGKKKELLQIINASLNSRGILPPGVTVSDIIITSTGIHPRFKVTEKLEQEVRDQLTKVAKRIEQIPIQVAKDSSIVALGARVEQLKEQVKSWELDDKFETLKILRDVLKNPIPSNPSIPQLLQKLNADKSIVLQSGFRIKIRNNGNKIQKLTLFADGFDCGTKSPLTIRLTQDTTKPFEPSLGTCLEDYIDSFFEKPLLEEDRWSIEFDANKMRFVVSGLLDTPLKMYVGLDGNIQWNYTDEEIKKLLIEPVLEEANKVAKETLETLNVQVTSDVAKAASDVLTLWESALETIGFQLKKKDALRQQLQNATDISQLMSMTLKAELEAIEGFLKGTTISNVLLTANEGLVPDFSKAIANLSTLKNEVNNWAPEYVRLKEDLKLAAGVIKGQVMLTLPDFRPIYIPLHIDIRKKKVSSVNFREIVLQEIVQTLNKEILPYELYNSDVSIEIKNVAYDNKKLIFGITMSIVTGDFNLPIQADMIIDLASKGIQIIPRKDLLDVFLGMARSVLEQVSIPFLEENSWIKNVSFFPSTGMPKGLKIAVNEIPLFGTAKIEVPALMISGNGIRFAENGSIKITFDGVQIVVPPFKLIEPTGEIVSSNLTFSGKLTLIPEGSENVIYAKGSFNVDLKEPLIWRTRTDVVAFRVFNLGYSKQEVDFKNGQYAMQIDFGGPLKDIIAIKGQALAKARGPKIDASGNVHIFGESVATGRLKLDLAHQIVQVDSKIEIPVTGSIKSHFSTQRHFSNPTIGAAKDLKIGKFKLSKTKFLISPSMASAEFKVLGLSMGLQVPSYKELDSDAFKKLLKNLLSPDLENLDEALLALLSGNITINPFSGFGPGGGAVGGSGGDGGGGGSNSNGSAGNAGYEGSAGMKSTVANNNQKSASGGTLQSVVSESPKALTTPNQKTVGNGKSAVLLQGDYLYPVIKEGSFYRAFEVKSQTPSEKKPMTFVGDLATLKNHFVQDGGSNEYHSSGLLLQVTPQFYAHILQQSFKETPSGDHAVIHWYLGEEQGKVKHLQLPLSQLEGIFGNVSYSQLSTKIASDKALAYWLRGLSQAVGSQPYVNDKNLIVASSIFRLSSTSPEQHAVAFRFFNDLDYTLIIATDKGSRIIKIPDIKLIQNNANAQRSLLNLIDKHQATSIGLFEKENVVYLYTGCDPQRSAEFTYQLNASGFTELSDARKKCESQVPIPSPKPTPIKEPSPIDATLTGSGGCAARIEEKDGQLAIRCGMNPPFAYAPKQWESYTLYRKEGSWIVNTPQAQIWKLRNYQVRYIVNPAKAGEAILWIGGNKDFKVSKLAMDTNPLLSWSRLRPEAYQSNTALHGAFTALSNYVETMLWRGSIIKESSVSYFEEGNIAAFVVQFTKTPSSDYYIFIGNSVSGKQVSRTLSSTIPPLEIPNFKNYLKTISK